MKHKLITLTLIILSVFMITSCTKKEESEEKIVTEEILEGIVDSYKFTVTDEVTERIRIQMENGEIMLAVLSNKSTPITIENFQKLVSEHFYDGLVFHRIMKGFMIQTGAPTATGSGGSNQTIKGEFSENGVENNLSHTRGVLSMARATNPNSASSQFFIVHEDSKSLDGKYASFGKVFAGFDVLDKIANTEVTTDERGEKSKPVKQQKIKSIRFITIEEA